MKALETTIGLFILTILVCNNSMAQKVSFTNDGGISIGLGAGIAYQKSDLDNSDGFGLDFVLGSQLYNKKNAFLSVDWKFRFLAGENKAYNLSIPTDNNASNIRYSFFSYDLELGLTLNRLRERTRIVLTGFAGAGITHGRTFTDLYDEGNFETPLLSKVAILPTAGVFAGYQISRSITAGIEFKTNFYLTEENSLVGINLDDKIISGSSLDRNNYVSLGFRWNIRGSSSSKHQATKTENPVHQVSLPKPSVNITDPTSDSYHTVSNTHTLWAIVNNVDGPDNISFYQNGFPNNIFSYNPSTKIFIATVNLREGENRIRIKAANQTSTAEDMVTITLGNPPEVPVPAPQLGFTNPSRNATSSSSAKIDVTARVKNISSKQDIELLLNANHTSFEYNPATGLVKTSVVLTRGDNVLLIKGFNESGSAEDQLSVNFDKPEEIAIPTVRFINPAAQVHVQNMRFPLKALTQYVRGRNDVKVKLNGASINNFFFSASGALSADLFLSEGVNTINITARNAAGQAAESASIIYQKPVYREPVNHEPVFQEPVFQEPIYQEPVHQEPVKHEPVHQEPVYQKPVYREPVNQEPAIRTYPPEIHILSPLSYPHRTYQGSEELRATVLNISSKEDITLNFNGISARNFSFNNSTKVLTARVALRDGENILTIQAQNESGAAVKEQLFIKETRPCPQPSIRLIDHVQGQSKTNQQIYPFRARVQNISNSEQLRLTVNGKVVSHTFSKHTVSSSVPLISGLNTLFLSAINECGEAKASAMISYSPSVVTAPCTMPKVSFTLNEVTRKDATHELRGSVQGVINKADISLTVNGKTDHGFQFVPPTGDLSARFKLTPGSHMIVVSVKNDCGTDTESETLKLSEETCGIRINPGNAAWQFCLLTPSGTFSRENLTNANFSYSGPATSLYFMPIGGGGEATVNGSPYAIKSGQYYLFTGNLDVTVSTKNPGSMGQWSVCIRANNAPVSGNGNSRPKSPCEIEKSKGNKGGKNRR